MKQTEKKQDLEIPKVITMNGNGTKVEIKFEDCQTMGKLRKYLQLVKQIQKMSK